MNVKQIYENFLIPPNLQKHMIRVAALSQMISENLKEQNLDNKSIILTCLFHDMANIIKFDFNKKQLFEGEENKIDYWKKIQKDVIKKYGTNIHKITLQICREIGLSSKTLQLVENLEWTNTLKFIESNDLESAICIYSDMRIGPFGIMPLKDRIANLQSRNKEHNFDFIKQSAEKLEQTIQQNLKINVNSITDEQLNSLFESLLKIEI